ncbi:MAG: hypothetical protein H6730_16055 [Deltaproteobacteria bacterium]|nr:hypothetical protein [Deltaproteobacteria bacterium]
MAAFLRFSDLETNPPGLWQDEASTGLDAYLLWTTGKDRAGEAFPIIARSFGDYPLAGYRYLSAPIVGLLGLTTGHERLVAAIFGTLLVLAAFWAARQRLGRGLALFAAPERDLRPHLAALLPLRVGGDPAARVPHPRLGAGGLGPRRGAPRRALAGRSVAGRRRLHTYHAAKVFLPLWLLGFLVLEWPLIKALWSGRQRHHVVGPALVFTLGVLPPSSSP